MKFGIFYELQLPKPWGPNDELNLYQNALDQVELADKLGYDYAWEVEHHFLDEYSHSPQPEVFLAAASQRTKRIRMGHGIIQLTTNHPGARRREDRLPRPRLEGPRRIRHGRVRQRAGAGAVRHRHGPEARDLGRRGQLHHPDDVEGRLAVRRPVLQVPAAQRHAEADPAAASAAVGRLLAARDHRDGGTARHRRARLPVPHLRDGACVGARLLQRLHQAAGEALRVQHQRQHRDGVLLHVRGDRRGGAPPGRRHHLLPVRARLLLRLAQPRTRRARHRQHVGRVQQVEDRPIRRRTRRRCAAA